MARNAVEKGISCSICFLKEADLTHVYPDLVHNLTFGCPIGNVDPIKQTYISFLYNSDIATYFDEERSYVQPLH
jgi:hypothetical protein